MSHQSNDVELFDEMFASFLAAARAYLAIVNDRFEGGAIPRKQTYRRKFPEGRSRIVATTVPDFSALGGGVILEFIKLPDVNTCIHLHMDRGLLPMPEFSDIDGKPVENPGYENYGWYLGNLLFKPIMNSIGQAKELKGVTDQMLKDCYSPYFESWTGKTNKREVYVPLLRGSIDEAHEIVKGVCIEPFSEPLKEELFNEFFEFNSHHQFEGANAILRISEVWVGFEYLEKGDDSALIALLSAIRLETGSEFSVNGFFTKSFRPVEITGPISYRPGPEEFHSPIPFSGSTVAPIDGFMRVADRLKTLGKVTDKVFWLAVRRFNLSLGRQHIEDRLLDLTIALECLLVSGNQELNFRLKVFAAQFLKPDCNPKETFDLLHAVYDLRSKIVHEGEIVSRSDSTQKILKKANFKNLNAMVIALESVSRSIILRFADRLAKEGQSLKAIQDDLIQKVIGSIEIDKDVNGGTA